jgi:tRNA(Arg) A34 adenosine deaminase TadA
MQSERFPGLHVGLPQWVTDILPPDDRVYPTDTDRMAVAINLARENVRRETGGPFGAAIFDGETGRLIGAGVNVVVSSNWSGAHAEMIAFAVAQQRLETYDLGAEGMHAMELFTSAEPCAMCLGATFWTGIRRLVCAARGEDAEAIGFDEGPKPANWVGELEKRGISVTRDLMRREGQAVLEEYAECDGCLYNSRGDSPAAGPGQR